MLKNEGVTDGRERRVGGEEMAGHISTIPEMRSLGTIFSSYIPWEVSSLP